MLLSVCMITYNHQDYIKQAVESVLNQKTEFDFELIIGEDCSTDSTKEILLKLKEKYPDKIQLVMNEKNQGMMKNFTHILQKSKAKYLALLEGDDYWTEPTKLQKQVDFLEQNPDFVICFHQVEVVYEYQQLLRNNKASHLLTQYVNQTIFDIKDTFVVDWFIGTSSLVFRNHILPSFPSWFYTCASGDIPLVILLAHHGKIKYINQLMSVYRKHEGGISNTHGGAMRLKYRLFIFKNLNKYFNYKYYPEIRKIYAREYLIRIKYLKSQYLQRIFFNKIGVYRYYIFYHFYSLPSGFKNKLLYIVLTFFPSIYQIYTRIKKWFLKSV